MAVPPAPRRLVRERARRRCEDCHADARWQCVRFTLAPGLPPSAGGADEADNVALACRTGNERRGNRLEGRAPETQAVVSLCNPRRDLWAEHLAWDATRLRIVGCTPRGRAAAEIRDRNDDRHDGTVRRSRVRDVADGDHPPPDAPRLSA